MSLNGSCRQPKPNSGSKTPQVPSVLQQPRAHWSAPSCRSGHVASRLPGAFCSKHCGRPTSGNDRPQRSFPEQQLRARSCAAFSEIAHARQPLGGFGGGNGGGGGSGAGGGARGGVGGGGGVAVGRRGTAVPNGDVAGGVGCGAVVGCRNPPPPSAAKSGVSRSRVEASRSSGRRCDNAHPESSRPHTAAEPSARPTVRLRRTITP